jgi:hypothetical protein
MTDRLSDQQARDELRTRDDALLWYLWREIEALKIRMNTPTPMGPSGS